MTKEFSQWRKAPKHQIGSTLHETDVDVSGPTLITNSYEANCQITFGPLKCVCVGWWGVGGCIMHKRDVIPTWIINTDINTLKLKVTVCTLISYSIFNFTSNVLYIFFVDTLHVLSHIHVIHQGSYNLALKYKTTHSFRFSSEINWTIGSHVNGGWKTISSRPSRIGIWLSPSRIV